MELFNTTRIGILFSELLEKRVEVNVHLETCGIMIRHGPKEAD